MRKFKLRHYTNNGNEIYELCSKMISTIKSGIGIYRSTDYGIKSKTN